MNIEMEMFSRQSYPCLGELSGMKLSGMKYIWESHYRWYSIGIYNVKEKEECQ